MKQKREIKEKKTIKMSAIEQLISEGREYARIKRNHDTSRLPQAGTAAYLISVPWMDAYEKYVCYDDIRFNMKPKMSEDHLQTKHPGSITNISLLDQDERNLTGTGTVRNLETEYLDRYLAK